MVATRATPTAAGPTWKRQLAFCERAKHGRSGGLAHETHAECNLNTSDKLMLQTCLSVAHDVIVILLLLVSLAHFAEWKVEDEPNLSKLVNPDGSCYSAAVAACAADRDRLLKDCLGKGKGTSKGKSTKAPELKTCGT